MENQLTHLSEFNDILSTYSVSPRALKVLNLTKLVLLIAPSASGRNTLITKLLTTGKYNFIVSDTTRKPRSNNGVMEKNGREYWFRSEDEFLNDLKQGEYLEAEVIHNQQVSGISIRELEKASLANKISVTDIDIGGVRNILKAKPDVTIILVLPPSFNEWQRRFISRGDLHDNEYNRRMRTALTIYIQAPKIKNIIYLINDSVEHGAEEVEKIVNGDINKQSQIHAKELIATLIAGTTKALQK